MKEVQVLYIKVVDEGNSVEVRLTERESRESLSGNIVSASKTPNPPTVIKRLHPSSQFPRKKSNVMVLFLSFIVSLTWISFCIIRLLSLRFNSSPLSLLNVSLKHTYNLFCFVLLCFAFKVNFNF